MAEYQGHRSWNAWNVSLYINNEEPLYRRAVELVKRHGADKAARYLRAELPEKTRDGATYNVTCVREALRDILS